jgi:hypothetical protein
MDWGMRMESKVEIGGKRLQYGHFISGETLDPLVNNPDTSIFPFF